MDQYQEDDLDRMKEVSLVLTSVNQIVLIIFRIELSTSKNIFNFDLLWDYLKINLEPLILASPDGHLWSEATVH